MVKEEGNLAFTRENKVVMKISLAIFSGLFLQAATIIWWASRLDYRVTVMEQYQTQASLMMERVTRVEEKVTNIQAQNVSIDNRLQTLLARSDYKPR